MATRHRKTRKYRGSRTHGWGQVAQHRASGHKGGLGVSGQLKHHFSSMLKENPDHFGHDSTHTPRSNDAKRWVNVRDLDDLFTRIGRESAGGSKIINLTTDGYKLLGGGSVSGAYRIIVKQFTNSAEEKVREAGGQVLSDGSTDDASGEAKDADGGASPEGSANDAPKETDGEVQNRNG